MDGANVWYSDTDLELQMRSLQDAIQNEQKETLTIAVIGQHGCGKSSFLNTVMAVFSGEFHERALVGNFDEEGEHMTRRLNRYPQNEYLTENKEIRYRYPTLLDMTGFQNTDDVSVRKTLELLFNGCLKDRTRLNVQAQNKRNSLDMLRQFLLGDSKVDRIIFVASATSRECPTELIRAVRSQAMDGRRDIPIFGILTHADQIEMGNPLFKEFERRFKNSLGLTEMRYMLCSTYCDDILRNENRNPQIEVPVAIFLQQVLDPAREVYEEKFNIAKQLMNLKLKQLLEWILMICIFTYLLFWTVPPSCILNCWYKPDTTSKMENSNKDRSSALYFFVCFHCINYCVKFLCNVLLSCLPDHEEFLNQRIQTFFRQ